MVNPADLVRPQPEDVEKQVAEILAETVTTPAEEADQLTRAHAVLHRALQQGH
ncbi:hypothetical protein [Corynebacterium sp.]|mgnify:CR=1 FL=1|uniref:hypothetical protein n=1 Tax=Corynebacterium sp. TaxID=1720 RepID=UPI00199204DF|nr:hypothetical protein [Corynebacterium sp.]HHU67531.1 hypothetical protein [Corynebacterium sp.]HKM24082.1 hypothetical protein [Corynebacterium sp.]